MAAAGNSSNRSIGAIDGQAVLSVDPDSGTYPPTGGSSEHMLVNLSADRLAIKVRCSDNTLFRVSPVFTFIDAGQCTNLVINRLPGPPKTDKVVLHYLKNTDPNAVLKDLFKAADAKPEKITIPLNCVTATEKMPVIGEEKRLTEKK